VSEAGLERLGQRNGFDCLLYMAPDGRKMRALIIAGSSTQIEIVLDNNIVQNVTLAFPESSESTSRHMEPASKILLEDLRLPPNQSPLTKTLDKFALNLETLAALDRLSVMPTFDCRAALVGIYTSLERLHQWDISRLREKGTHSEKMLPLLAMCSRNGLPAMHARNRAGLALRYWKERRLIPPESESTASFAENREKIWSLIIGCASMDGLQIPPARVSEDWLSKDMVKDDGLGGDPKSFPLDWQEPVNVALPASEETKNIGIEMMQPDLSTIRVPAVIFTVTFDPPIVLPQSDVMRLYACADMEPPPPHMRPPTFDQLYFPIPPGVHQGEPSEPRTIKRERQVSLLDRNRNATIKTHHNTLFIYKQIYSMRVSSMAFCHPRQLISMLPLLRQWAFTSTLLENSFGPGVQDPAPSAPLEVGKEQANKTKSEIVHMSEKDQLASFMGLSNEEKGDGETSVPDDAELSLDVIIWVHPAPHFQVNFPFRGSKASITLQILENGVVDIVDENILGPGRETKGLTRAGLGKSLEHMEDLCKWAEWIRSRLS
jgi:hypothetical protein